MIKLEFTEEEFQLLVQIINEAPVPRKMTDVIMNKLQKVVDIHNAAIIGEEQKNGKQDLPQADTQHTEKKPE